MRELIVSEWLRKVVEREFPEIALPKTALFMPMYSLDVGELSSTAAVEIAKVLKQRAEGIAERIITELSRHIEADWRHDNGYIVCSNVSTNALLSEIPESVPAAVASITDQSPLPGLLACQVWCLIPDSTEPVYARMRVVARATLQGLLAVVYQGRSHLCLYPCPGRDVTSVAEAIAVFREAIEWIISNNSEVRRTVVLPEQTARCAVWTTHHYHERLDSASRGSLSTMRRAGVAQVSMPDDGWLLSRDRALSEILELTALRRVVERLASTDDWFRFLFHLASTTPSGDFDPAVALFDESASPLWNMRALLERYGRFGSILPLPVAQSSLAQLIQQVRACRKLVLCGLFLPLYTARAILHNDVAAWCEAFERLAREGHSFLNAPATRLLLEEHSEDRGCVEIAAGLGFGLSCILPLVAEA